MQKSTIISRACAMTIIAACFSLLLYASDMYAAKAKNEKVYVVKHFSKLRKNFGKSNTDKPEILSGPTMVQMLNDQSSGKVWQVKLGETTFKVTIQDKTGMSVEECLERLERVPKPYRKLFEIVSEDNKAGMAFYAELGGAAAHGSQNYLNMVPRADAFVIVHEAGHILEQRITSSNPKTLEEWKKAIEKDKVSISRYGDQVAHEDLAEFALVYALCLDSGKKELAELKKLSPRRYALWETILTTAKAAPLVAEQSAEAKSSCSKQDCSSNPEVGKAEATAPEKE